MGKVKCRRTLRLSFILEGLIDRRTYYYLVQKETGKPISQIDLNRFDDVMALMSAICLCLGQRVRSSSLQFGVDRADLTKGY